MIAEGKYQAKASPDVELGRTPNTQTAFVRVQFEITAECEFRGHQIHWDGWLTEKTSERTMDSLEHCGWDGASLSNPQGVGTKECSIVIEHEQSEKDGKLYPRVKWVNALGGGAKLKDEVKLDAAALRSIDQEFKASLMERRQKNGAQASRPSAAPRTSTRASGRPYDDNFGPMPSDDDIPF